MFYLEDLHNMKFFESRTQLIEKALEQGLTNVRLSEVVYGDENSLCLVVDFPITNHSTGSELRNFQRSAVKLFDYKIVIDVFPADGLRASCLYEDELYERERADYVLKSAIKVDLLASDVSLSDQFEAQRLQNKNLQHSPPATLPDELLMPTNYNATKSDEYMEERKSFRPKR